MKRVVAYISTMRVHRVVEELRGIGIDEILVTEHFTPRSQISRFEFLCPDELVERARGLVRGTGSKGGAGEVALFVEAFDEHAADPLPLGHRMNRLERRA